VSTIITLRQEDWGLQLLPSVERCGSVNEDVNSLAREMKERNAIYTVKCGKWMKSMYISCLHHYFTASKDDSEFESTISNGIYFHFNIYRVSIRLIIIIIKMCFVHMLMATSSFGRIIDKQ
jgi:hypothetical protein